ncbi:MAG: NADH-quinone oxidoreductase subunit L [Pirellulales bacterium]|nr:NADH-quinone oxidoreductase subunit L [Pirellulales bacterium]
MNLPTALPTLLGTACLLPLLSFVVILFFGKYLGKHGKGASYVAAGAIIGAFALSAISLCGWVGQHPLVAVHHGGGAHHADAEQAWLPAVVATKLADANACSTSSPIRLANLSSEPAGSEHAAPQEAAPVNYNGDWYTLFEVGSLKLTIGYYIDALTVAMFAMVTLIASCIHIYAIGYMHDELHDVTDHEVALADGHHLHRPGRFPRFFQYLSLFCFSMLGLVISGNLLMTFVFWELVGICSYFLIGFYFERKSASNAANKAFIVNRVGDFGFIIGLMALFGAIGTFQFGDTVDDGGNTIARGIFSQLRPPENDYKLTLPDGMVLSSAGEQVAGIVNDHADMGGLTAAKSQIESQIPDWRKNGFGYGLLIVAGLGIFCGCVGKSAQFPLHVWLPDAMEGPTPVSALVHSATMVAAGVFFVGRCFPIFTQEVLLVIAYIGCITLFIAATIAMVAVDIKRVLAYSTVSQLGYMMLALGIGGWVAGLFHLFTHAFFKSLLFMCSGSVIHACHTNDMRKMGGLLKKMPYTGYTMLVGCLAIIGTGIPFVAGFSGYYSKDSIIAQALSFTNQNPVHRILFLAAAGGASMTAFYMFRLWFLTFIGKPRDHHVYDHAHESPPVMWAPLVLLAAFAFGIGWPLWGLTNMLEQARPAGTIETVTGAVVWPNVVHPSEYLSHEEAIHVPASLIAFGTALSGFLLAAVFYAWQWLNPAEVQQQFGKLHTFLWNKWYFDELYNAIIVQPVHFVARRVADFDKHVIDRFIDGCATAVRGLSTIDDAIDRLIVDGAVNLFARWMHSAGIAFRSLQTGSLRQYVMFIVVGMVAIFVLVSFFWNYAWAM